MDNNFNKTNNQNEKKPREISKPHHNNFGLFDPFFDDFFRFPDFRREFKEMDKVMKTDVTENENDYVIEIEMPGYDKENISLELNNGYLTVEAKQKTNNDEKDKKGNYIRRERYYGSCSRSFYVGDIKEEDISASLDRGILNITVPKEKKVETKKRIEIK